MGAQTTRTDTGTSTVQHEVLESRNEPRRGADIGPTYGERAHLIIGGSDPKVPEAGAGWGPLFRSHVKMLKSEMQTSAGCEPQTKHKEEKKRGRRRKEEEENKKEGRQKRRRNKTEEKQKGRRKGRNCSETLRSQCEKNDHHCQRTRRVGNSHNHFNAPFHSLSDLVDN